MCIKTDAHVAKHYMSILFIQGERVKGTYTTVCFSPLVQLNLFIRNSTLYKANFEV